jgi:hypothetical protein
MLVASTAAAGCSSTPPYRVDDCTRTDLGGKSVARVWDDQLLELIRQVVPAPTVHARNLFHTSAAMWDAWAAYDPTADGYFVTDKLSASDADRTAARETAMSFAAYRILLWRYGSVADLPETEAQLDATMAKLCYRPDFASTGGGSPAALGNRIAASVLEFGKTDGSQERDRYFDSTYQPVNKPLEVAEPGTTMVDPDRWQPLSLDKQLSQNGLPIPGKVQTAIGTQWGHVAPFALPPSDDGTPIDPGAPPRLTDSSTSDDFKEAALEVIRFSSMLDATDGVTMDIGPGAIGDNSLGSNDGDGTEVNPVTGQPYEPNQALRADFARVLAEFWADGPKSETPPGHWNVVANSVVESPGFIRKLAGQGSELDPLEWDVKMYLALNGALHDAAIAAWGLKGHYDSARPISMIRYMGGRGRRQPSDLHTTETGCRSSRGWSVVSSPPPRASATRPSPFGEIMSGPGAASRRTPRSRPAASAGSEPSIGCPTSARRSSLRRSPATSPVTARSVARRPRS